MNGSASPNGMNRDTWDRFKHAVSSFLSSSVGRKGIALLTLLVVFLLAINGLNVLNSYVGRDFISSIENRNKPQFLAQAWLFIGVFALSTVVAVMLRYAEERLALLWRDWQTRRLLDAYLDEKAYYSLEIDDSLPNPDQRISEDIRTFTATTLSFFLMSLNGLFTFIAFSGVLWSINPRLFFVAVVYAVVGTLLTVLLGKRLVGLNNQQLDREADFRSELIHVRENAESLALLHQEQHQKGRLVRCLDALVSNTRRMISVNRNLSFFTTGYSYMIQIIPALVVAPIFMRGDVPFGVVTQSAMAFAQLMGAFSLIVTQFQSISSYAAVIRRLGKLGDAIEAACTSGNSPIELRTEDGPLRYENLSLQNTQGAPLIKNLNLTIEPGTRTLIVGQSGYAKAELLKATAGLSCNGTGRIIRPNSRAFLFLPERPYLPKGNLRDVLAPAEPGWSLPDEKLHEVLRALQLEKVVEHAGGLDTEHEWTNFLSLNEQAMLAMARTALAKPKFVFADRLTLTMDKKQASDCLRLFSDLGITFIVMGKPEEHLGEFDATLHIFADGAWTWMNSKTP